MNYLDELNDSQRKAVTHTNGPVLIIAGPGSGKTRVLTYRIAHLVKEGISPREILALTFTNKAAREMKERIVQVIGTKANPIWAGTFHAMFARILRKEATKIGYPAGFSIYDVLDVKNAIKEVVNIHRLDPKVYNPDKIYRKISMAKNALVSPAQYKNDSERLLSDARQRLPYLYKIYDFYVKKLQRAGAMDFDDLLYQMHRLLSENPEHVLEKYREKFKYILVDEFQDTNQLQYSIIQYLIKYPGSSQNICAVGDDAQSIYAFRGATIQNILNFQKDYPALTVYKLEQNYRSTHRIVQAANCLIAKNKKQLRKTIFTKKGEGQPIRVIPAMSDVEEARHVVDNILEQQHRKHYEYKDFAILYRTNAQSRVFEEALKRRRIPYRIYGGISFFNRKEVKDCLAYLRVIVNPKDEQALKRIINYPARGIGSATVKKLTQLATQESWSLWEVIKRSPTLNFANRTSQSLQKFASLIELCQQRLTSDNAYGLAHDVIRMSEILKDLKKDKTTRGKNRVDNVRELLDGIKAFVENDEYDELTEQSAYLGDKSLNSYLQNVVLLTGIDITDDEEDTNCVNLMSVHGAKGLEFKSVFVVGMEEDLFPSKMARNHDEVAEERRLFYVAITRAEEELTLLHSKSRYRFGKPAYNNVSRFLEELELFPQNTPIEATRSSDRGFKKGRSKSSFFRRTVAKTYKKQAHFIPSPFHEIVTGAKIMHERFGTGKVISMNGDGLDRVATILFDQAGEKRILLRYAKLRVV